MRTSLAILTTLLLGATLASAGGGSFDIPWYTIDGGGGTSVGGAFELSGTIGQPDAGVTMTGGSYALTGGFWVGAASTNPCVGDLTGDGTTDLADLGLLFSCWSTPCGDVTGDGLTDLADLGVIFGDWNCGM